MIIQKRTLGWLPQPSLYSQQAAARAKMKATHSEFLGNQSSFLDQVSSIQGDAMVQTGQLITKIAVARISSKLA